MEYDDLSSYLSIRMVDRLPAHLADAAAKLYLSALDDHLAPVFGKGFRARQALAHGFRRQRCLCAIEGDRLIGLMGVETTDQGLLTATSGRLPSIFGHGGALWRKALLSLMSDSPSDGEAHIDGMAVIEAYRNRGIGTHLVGFMESWAADENLSILTLEVVDANHGATRFYRRLGFEVVRKQTVWPCGSWTGSQASSVMIKPIERPKQQQRLSGYILDPASGRAR